jgi:hypothetical protein
MLEYYDVGGASIDITKVTLPIKKRAFFQCGHLRAGRKGVQ